MVTVNKNILISNLVFLFAGLLLGYFLFHSTPVSSSVIKENMETTETTRTEEVKKEVEAVSPGKITNEVVPVTHLKHSAELLKGSVVNSTVPSFVANWDTTATDGFEAHIKYFINENLFVNSFKYPEKTIYKDKIVTKTVSESKTEVVTELPAFLIGGGVKSSYENQLKIYPFLHLAANTKLWFMTAQVELKGLIDNQNLSVKIIPEIEGKLSIGL